MELQAQWLHKTETARQVDPCGQVDVPLIDNEIEEEEE